jgi:[ribosomal protein S5]-alanine N-acetyltransferase
MDNPATLETDRLVLSPLCPADAPALHAVFAQPEAMRFWTPPGHAGVAETLAQIEKWIAGPGTFWALHPRAGGDAVGIVYYIGNPGAPGMGYLLHPSQWGKGLMTEAVAVVLTHGFGPMGLDRVELWIEARNLASRRLA